jgi:2-polyprenyl-6-methoxyphenol hydroxylase-like FAD-dependent oxidoreductase
MSATSRRALVIGGSLGGFLAANLLLRAGWDVEVFEQSSAELTGRGAGIISHPALFHALQRIGISLDDSYGVDVPIRTTHDRSGATIATLAIRQIFTTWGRLHQLLREAFPRERYHFGASFARLAQDDRGITARFASGRTARGDLLVGADGVRSSVRAQLAPAAKPRYAGYVGWRGLAEENALTPAVHRELIDKFIFCLPPCEMMLCYPVAGFTNSTRPGERCLNFVWYRPADESRELARLCTDVNGRRHGMSIPPPLIRPEVLAELRSAADEFLSPQLAEVVRHARQPFFQPIFDVESPHMAFGRVALVGDAAFVARPHVGMGVTKGAGDATALADCLVETGNDVPSALARYESRRLRVNAAVVAHGRELGAWLQGINTPEAHRHHTPEAVMAEIAVTRDYP